MSAHAGFGGSRGGFSTGRSYSAPSVSRSSFGGTRSTVSAPIVRSVPSYSRPAIGSGTTTNVYHSGGYGGNGFFTGMMMGHLMSRPTTIVQGGGVVDGGYAPQSSGLSFLMGLVELMIWLSLISLLAFGIYYGLRKWQEKWA